MDNVTVWKSLHRFSPHVYVVYMSVINWHNLRSQMLFVFFKHKTSFHKSSAVPHIWILAEWVWRRSMRMWSWLENTPCWGTTALRWSVIRGSWSRSENTSALSETPLYSRNGSRLEFLPGYCSNCLKVWLRLFNAFVCSCCLIQVWQEINEETKQVREIMATLESFQLESTPSKPSSFGQENDIMPVHVEHRYMSMSGFIINCPDSHHRVTQTLLLMQ